ncbi:MAG: hypothetical protein WCD79_09635 [Chthoniobacteraceae bacterium]
MIDVQEAVKIALAYCGKLFGKALNRFQLEEVELDKDEKHWFITVGFDEPLKARTDVLGEAFKGFLPKGTERKFKIVDVDAKSGKVRAVKIRQPLERVS